MALIILKQGPYACMQVHYLRKGFAIAHPCQKMYPFSPTTHQEWWTQAVVCVSTIKIILFYTQQFSQNKVILVYIYVNTQLFHRLVFNKCS